MDEFTFVRDISWDEVLAGWQKGEEEIWREYYTGHGFKSWLEWRSRRITQMKLSDRSWKLYQINSPLETVPNFFAGAFPGWHKYYPVGTQIATFSEIAEHPDIYQNEKVMGISKSFPPKTTMILFTKDLRTVVWEGMHRSAALALAFKKGIRDLSVAPAPEGGVPILLFAVITEFARAEEELFCQSYVQESGAPTT